MTIRARLSTAILGVAALAVALIGGLGLFAVRTFISALELRLAENARSQLLSAIENRAAQNEGYASLLAHLPAVRVRMADNDRPGLLADLGPAFAALHAYGIDNTHLHRPDTTTLVRLHAPAQYDDDLSRIRPMIVEVNRTGMSRRGLELGVNGLPIRGAVPVLAADGRPLGVIEVGSFIDAEFLARFSEAGTAYTVFHANGGTLSLFASSGQARAPRLDATVLHDVLLRSNVVTARAQREGVSFLSTAAPLRDFAGKPIGVVQIDIDTTRLEEAYDFAIKLLLAGTGLIGLLAALAAIMTALGILRPLESLVRTTEQIAAGRLGAPVQFQGRTDQLGQFARAIEQFRMSKNALRDAYDRAETATQVLQDVIDTVPAVINFKDRDLKYVVVNRACAEFYGMSREQMIGRRISDMVSGLDMKALEQAEHEVLRSGQALTPRDFVGRSAKGRLETWWTVKAPVRKESSIAGIVTVAIDLTELKQAQHGLEQRTHDLQEANRRLERQTVELERLNAEYLAGREAALAASRAKSEFLANVSHELRTPLNAVIGYSEVMLDELFGPLAPRYRDYVGDILQGGQHLLAVINDILDMARIEAGTHTLNKAKTDLGAVFRSAIQLVHNRAEMKEQLLTCTIAADMPELSIDGQAMRQVMVNLIGNAIKFTGKGGRIEVVAGRRGDGAVEIEVRDNGRGIAPEHLPHVFTPFWQAEEVRKRSHEGMGLGLSICRKLVEAHGGSIAIASEPEKGTRVTVTLPAGCVMPGDGDPAREAGAGRA